MKRRTLDLVFSVGGVVIAALLAVLGLVLTNQSHFAKRYVRDQLSAQKITFTPADKLTAEEAQASCLVANGGSLLQTGKQAECYANRYIALHVAAVNNGKTYAETSTESRAARTAADAALQANANDPNAIAQDAQAKALAAKTDTLFKGETLRGLLLTSYGFSIFGERAATAALVCYLLVVVLALASLAGLIHAFTTAKDQLVLTAPARAPAHV